MALLLKMARADTALPPPFPRTAPAPRHTRKFQSDVFPLTARSVTDTP
ncbi:hypothetical protein NBRC3257_1196 [Gluconobacter thailandicus NBRC 3257]|uniref:Uncharacterized protein n=1 Tax=Gluconobacter thailandicus NBRC 3257 TaxID=1381097 RepID=A0ABQ0IVH2_GLUTH|nr:hypothetical protein NBRC3257_1196 [Gluconobacter thailandicus NBRC 3257]